MREDRLRNGDKRRAAQRLKRKKEREAERIRHNNWNHAHPERVKAHAALRYAVRKGKVAKPETCSRCGSRDWIQGHHADYSKPLDVIWLCNPCHRAEHRTIVRDGVR
jgi:hypothetical protein